jgi:hypothetical protein
MSNTDSPLVSSIVETPISRARLRGISTMLDANGFREFCS